MKRELKQGMAALSRQSGLSSALRKKLGSLVFVWAMVRSGISVELKRMFTALLQRMISFLNPYHEIKIYEHLSGRMVRNELYSHAEAYLSEVCSHGARKLHAEVRRKSSGPLLAIAEHEEVVDTFQGAKLWWCASSYIPKCSSVGRKEGERFFYRLIFHKKHRKLVEHEYLKHILDEGRAVVALNRQRYLFTNIYSGGL